MKKDVRELTGMKVTELRAVNQQDLFEKLAKWASKGFKNVASIDLDHLGADYDDGPPEVAIVVWC